MNIDIIGLKCTGCTVCLLVCPHNAISFIKDKYGFNYPQVDNVKCTQCGLCVHRCPVYNNKISPNSIMESYAVMCQDDIRYDSSSGGMFTVIAKYILSQGGSIFSVRFDENFNAIYDEANNECELEPFKKSKYVEVNLNRIFISVENKLNSSSSPVLFVGVPCHIHGLKTFLQKDYQNLICIDVLCAGASSYKIFDKFLSSIDNHENIKDFCFRDKEFGWNGLHYSITYKNGTKKTLKSDMELVLYKLYIWYYASVRECCISCNYKSINRYSDITLGDFWGIGAVDQSLDDNKGTSLVLLNTLKSIDVFEKIKDEFKLYKKISHEYAYNNEIINRKLGVHPLRKDFLDDLDKMSLHNNLQDKLENKKSIGIYNFSFSNINFGAVLTSFALQYFLKNHKNNYYVMNLNYTPHIDYINIENQLLMNKFEVAENRNFREFKEKYINTTDKRNFLRGLPHFNRLFNTFIIGSDQVFSDLMHNELFLGLMQFAENNKNIIACSASFGCKEFNNDLEKEIYSLSLSRFDTITIRETSGIEKCASLGIKNAKQILDPVFFIEQEVYDKLIEEAKVDSNSYDDYICYSVIDNFWNGINNYTTDNNDEKSALFSKLKRVDFDLSIEEWLYKIKHCKMLITNSFHGVCFAIIYGKEFISVNSMPSGDRVKSLLDLLEIKHHRFESISEIDLKKVFDNKINYKEVYAKLDMSIKYSQDILIEAVENNHYKQADTIIYKKYLQNKIADCYKKIIEDNEYNTKITPFNISKEDYDSIYTYLKK